MKRVARDAVQGMLEQPLARQQAVVSALQAAVEPLAPGPAAVASAEAAVAAMPLPPLLQLACGSPSPGSFFFPDPPSLLGHARPIFVSPHTAHFFSGWAYFMYRLQAVVSCM